MALRSATSAATFLNSIGVNTHVGYNDFTSWGATNAYNNFEQVKAALTHLGVKNIRDTFAYDFYMPEVEALGAMGIKFDVFMGTGDHVDYASEIARIRDHAEIIRYVEGPNEVDKWPANFGGQRGYDAAKAEMQALYADMKADARTTNIPVLNLTLGNPAANWSKVGDQSAATDKGAAHIYPGPDSRAGTEFEGTEYWASQQRMTPGVPMIITEGGYSTFPMASQNGSVTEDVHAKLTLNYLMEAFQTGIETTYLYELVDEYSDPKGNDREQHFGLFRNDWSPKPAATAIHNLNTIIKDTVGNTAPASLEYSVSNMPANGNDMLLHGADGTFYVNLWNDADLWDFHSTTTTSIPVVDTTLSFGSAYASIEIFDPLKSANALQTFANTASVQVSLPGHPVIVTVSAPAALHLAPASKPTAVTIGFGPDALVLKVSQDAYQGSAQYTVSVDGNQIGGTQTAVALHSFGQLDTVTVKGDWAPGAHTVSVNFLNDAYAGTSSTDRNFYIHDATYNGTLVADAPQSMMSAGPSAFSVSDTTAISGSSLPSNNLTATAGSNTLGGGIGSDTLSGCNGDDVLTGGDGADVFVLSEDGVRDCIIDFASDINKLRLEGLSAKEVAWARVKWPGLGQGTKVKYDDHNDGIWNDGVFLSGVKSLAASDFAFA